MEDEVWRMGLQYVEGWLRYAEGLLHRGREIFPGMLGRRCVVRAVV